MKKRKTELAWAAGFMDGEGSFKYQKNENRLAASLPQINKEPLDKFMQAVGVGAITGPYVYAPRPDGYNRKPLYIYSANGKDVTRLFKLLEPYLCSIKVRQFWDAVEKIYVGKKKKESEWGTLR